MTRKTKNYSSRKFVSRQTKSFPEPALSDPQPNADRNEPAWLEASYPWARYVLLFLLVLGLVLRIMHLSDLSLWMDEYVHVMRAKNFLQGDGPLFTDDNNGILLTLCLLPVFSAFGATAFWARFPSVLFGLGLIYVVYRFATRLFNHYVGLFAAGGTALSLFLLFWSRVCRNYAPLAVFYLLLSLLFWMALENKPDPKATNWWARNGLSRYHALLVPGIGILAILSHQLSFFFVFTVAVYSLIRLIFSFWSDREKPDRKKFAWLSGLTAPLLLVLFIPPLGEALKKGLAPFLLSNIADWAIPDWTRLASLSKDLPLDAFNLYNSLLQYDLNWLYIPALAGLVTGIWIRPRSGLWLLCSFGVPFLLMSFLFREPFLRRYLIFIYPLMLISAGVFFYALWHWLYQKWSSLVRPATWVLLPLPFLLLFANARWSEIGDLALARKLNGHIVDMRIASWSFTNWKEACAYVDQKRQTEDVLISTVPTAVSYYLDHKPVLWFRQAYFDTQKKQYILNTPKPAAGPSAATLEDLIRTVQQSPRGWLLADYYLENIFTDERALLWVYQNMHYYPEASSDGSVMVFGWDHSKPKPSMQNLVVELGRDEDKIESKEYHMVLPAELFHQQQIELTVRTRGVDTNREALVLFNGVNAVWLPPNSGAGIESFMLPLQREWVRPGSNTIQVLYEPKRPNDPQKGFTLYYLSITGK